MNTIRIPAARFAHCKKITFIPLLYQQYWAQHADDGSQDT